MRVVIRVTEQSPSGSLREPPYSLAANSNRSSTDFGKDGPSLSTLSGCPTAFGRHYFALDLACTLTLSSASSRGGLLFHATRAFFECRCRWIQTDAVRCISLKPSEPLSTDGIARNTYLLAISHVFPLAGETRIPRHSTHRHYLVGSQNE